MSDGLVWLIDVLLQLKIALIGFITVGVVLTFFIVLIYSICNRAFDEVTDKIKRFVVGILLATAICVLIPTETTLYDLFYDDTQDIIVLEVE